MLFHLNMERNVFSLLVYFMQKNNIIIIILLTTMCQLHDEHKKNCIPLSKHFNYFIHIINIDIKIFYLKEILKKLKYFFVIIIF